MDDKVRLWRCEPGQIVLWRPDFSFRWLLLRVLRHVNVCDTEVEVLAAPLLIYPPGSAYAPGNKVTWRSDEVMRSLNEMEMLAWASR